MDRASMNYNNWWMYSRTGSEVWNKGIGKTQDTFRNSAYTSHQWNAYTNHIPLKRQQEMKLPSLLHRILCGYEAICIFVDFQKWSTSEHPLLNRSNQIQLRPWMESFSRWLWYSESLHTTIHAPTWVRRDLTLLRPPASTSCSAWAMQPVLFASRISSLVFLFVSSKSSVSSSSHSTCRHPSGKTHHRTWHLSCLLQLPVYNLCLLFQHAVPPTHFQKGPLLSSLNQLSVHVDGPSMSTPLRIFYRLVQCPAHHDVRATSSNPKVISAGSISNVTDRCSIKYIVSTAMDIYSVNSAIDVFTSATTFSLISSNGPSEAGERPTHELRRGGRITDSTQLNTHKSSGWRMYLEIHWVESSAFGESSCTVFFLRCSESPHKTPPRPFTHRWRNASLHRPIPIAQCLHQLSLLKFTTYLRCFVAFFEVRMLIYGHHISDIYNLPESFGNSRAQWDNSAIILF